MFGFPNNKKSWESVFGYDDANPKDAKNAFQGAPALSILAAKRICWGLALFCWVLIVVKFGKDEDQDDTETWEDSLFFVNLYITRRILLWEKSIL